MSVEATTERVLRLLELLQRRPSWTATELAAELGVTGRSIRRDVERLRAVGYPVHATSGVGGGYQLGAGTRLPPLLFNDEEAIATAVSLRLAAGGTVAGAGEAALRALAKLDQVMPPRLRAEVHAVQQATDLLLGPGIEIDAELLMTLARACRDAVRVRFRYAARGGAEAERTVEPVRLVATQRRWYLMAWDTGRADWRTFRLDRMRELTATTWRFRPREHPDPAAYVQHSVAEAPYRHVARVRVHAPAGRIRELVPPQVGRVEEDGDGCCVLVVGGVDLDWIAVHVARLGFPAEVLEPPELRAAMGRLATRLAAMAGGDRPAAGSATLAGGDRPVPGSGTLAGGD
ncbi:helix-turn-helix transcriptional regulator [Crossiella sp. NPDC003009]